VYHRGTAVRPVSPPPPLEYPPPPEAPLLDPEFEPEDDEELDGALLPESPDVERGEVR